MEKTDLFSCCPKGFGNLNNQNRKQILCFHSLYQKPRDQITSHAKSLFGIPKANEGPSPAALLGQPRFANTCKALDSKALFK